MLASEPSPHEATEDEVGQAVPVLPRQASVAEVDHTCLRLVQVNELLFVYLGLIYGTYGTDLMMFIGLVIPMMIRVSCVCCSVPHAACQLALGLLLPLSAHRNTALLLLAM